MALRLQVIWNHFICYKIQIVPNQLEFRYFDATFISINLNKFSYFFDPKCHIFFKPFLKVSKYMFLVQVFVSFFVQNLCYYYNGWTNCSNKNLIILQKICKNHFNKLFNKFIWKFFKKFQYFKFVVKFFLNKISVAFW
jgi:hypothetical protein